MLDLYFTSYYFTVTTITTVGYGDISGNSSIERVICFFLHLIGVLTYSLASGSLTSIIANYDSYNEQNADKLNILNRLFKKENAITAELYNQLYVQIKNSYSPENNTEVKEFLDDLPFRMMVRTIMYIYKDSYEKIDFLRD